MAQNLDDNKVIQMSEKRGRGRPKGSTKMAQSAKAAQVAEEIMTGKKTEKVGEITEDFLPALGEPGFEDRVIADTAPSFGSNEPTASIFLQQVNILLAHEAKGEELKLSMQEWRKHKKTLRLGAQEAGIVMGELDQALKDHATELVDLRAKQIRYITYMAWLGHDLGIGEINEPVTTAKATDTEEDLMRWTRKGDIAGRLGQPRELPKGIPAHAVQAWLLGHEAGQKVLMMDSPLTKGAFGKDGKLKSTPEPTSSSGESQKLLRLTQANFQTGTEILDANLKTLLAGFHQAFHDAENVTAVFGSQVRVLKELMDDGTVYADTGAEDVEITDPVPVESLASEFV